MRQSCVSWSAVERLSESSKRWTAVDALKKLTTERVDAVHHRHQHADDWMVSSWSPLHPRQRAHEETLPSRQS